MAVILDVVLNHTSNDHPMMKQHPDWWMRDGEGNLTRETEEWSDVADWNYENPEVREYLREVLLYWANEFEVDGFRCDAADRIPIGFWRETVKALRDVKPGLYMLAEGQNPRLIEAGFDSDYDTALYDRLRDYARGEGTLDGVRHAVLRYDSLYPADARPLRFIENHDQVRAASDEAFGNPGYRPFAALIFTLPGQPMLYNGQETGTTLQPSLFEKEPIDWLNQDLNVLGTYRALCSLRNVSETLQHGGLSMLSVEPGDRVTAFTRSYRDDSLLVAINFDSVEVTSRLQAKYWSRGKWAVLSHSFDDTLNTVLIENGALKLPPLGWLVMRRLK
ncbi:hypothetical protein GF324_06255 [bacterium]|nr:hypothetical protein [bacterium]